MILVGTLAARARLRVLADGTLSIVGEAADLRQARAAGAEADAFLIAPAVELADDSQIEALTAREIEVLESLAKGMRNKEIGKSLRITEETVRAHIRSIFAKLNVHDRTAALAEALRRGIVRVEFVSPDDPPR